MKSGSVRAQSEKKSERARRNAVCRRILSFPFSSLLSLFYSLFLLHTQLDARYFRRPSSFGQFHCTQSAFPPSLPLSSSLSFSSSPLPSFLPRETRFVRKRPVQRYATSLPPRGDPRALFNEAKIAREQAAPSKFRYVFSRIIITRARARARFHCARCTKLYRV